MFFKRISYINLIHYTLYITTKRARQLSKISNNIVVGIIYNIYKFSSVLYYEGTKIKEKCAIEEKNKSAI